MSSKFLVAEPQPTVPAGHYTHAGRGGAGNTYRMSSSDAAVASASRPVQVHRSSKKFYSGIGGAGNVHAAEERAALSFSEEFDRARHREAATAGHIGVGGAGNVYRKSSGSSEAGSARSPRTSHESQSSSAGFWGRLSTSSFRH